MPKRFETFCILLFCYLWESSAAGGNSDLMSPSAPAPAIDDAADQLGDNSDPFGAMGGTGGPMMPEVGNVGTEQSKSVAQAESSESSEIGVGDQSRAHTALNVRSPAPPAVSHLSADKVDSTTITWHVDATDGSAIADPFSEGGASFDLPGSTPGGAHVSEKAASSGHPEIMDLEEGKWSTSGGGHNTSSFSPTTHVTSVHSSQPAMDTTAVDRSTSSVHSTTELQSTSGSHASSGHSAHVTTATQLSDATHVTSTHAASSTQSTSTQVTDSAHVTSTAHSSPTSTRSSASTIQHLVRLRRRNRSRHPIATLIVAIRLTAPPRRSRLKPLTSMPGLRLQSPRT